MTVHQGTPRYTFDMIFFIVVHSLVCHFFFTNKRQARGVNFENHYVNVPICCPSRSSMWSGRQPHNVHHMHNGLWVRGAWNNYEGVGINDTTPGVNEEMLIGPNLAKAGYSVSIKGKTDWVSGGHDLTTMVDSWSIYARFPYSVPEQGGFHIWGECGGNLSVCTLGSIIVTLFFRIIFLTVSFLEDVINKVEFTAICTQQCH